MAAAIAFAEEPPKLVLGKGFDPRLQELIDRCVSLDKEKRPSFREVLDTLLSEHFVLRHAGGLTTLAITASRATCRTAPVVH